MSTPEDLKGLYTDELKDLWSANDQMQRVLKEIAPKTSDPPSVWWTPMLAFRSWRGVSDECSTPELSGFFQARGR